MIRLIQQRLIIPRGDTGEFSIPILPYISKENAIAVFTIFNGYERLFSQTVEIQPTDKVLTFKFEHEYTKDFPIGIYNWDIKIYINPEYKNDLLINGEQVHSYYGGFELPRCEVVLAPKRG